MSQLVGGDQWLASLDYAWVMNLNWPQISAKQTTSGETQTEMSDTEAGVLDPTKEYSYDIVPYQSIPFPATHPNQLATIATLFGMEPVPIEKARVLEVACASGGNLIPMAMELPGSAFVGIDLSKREIGEAKETVAALGLKNIEFQRKNITEVGPDFGQFDYIIAHGVYSWVSEPVQDKLLDICCQNLSPQGIAAVSYNTLPGWHMKGMIRDMMLYHSNRFVKPETRIRQARAMLNFLAESVPPSNKIYGAYLHSECAYLRQKGDSYIFHEHLEEDNHPVYFYQFMERAEAHALQYLGDASFGAMALLPQGYSQKTLKTLEKISSNLIHREQYMDFLSNRTFRKTLLCHKNVKLDRSLRPVCLKKLYVSSVAKPVTPNSVLQGSGVKEFRSPDGVTLPIRNPIMQAALLHLSGIWPRATTFENLVSLAVTCLKTSRPPVADAIGDYEASLSKGLLSLCSRGFLALHYRELFVPPPISDQLPVANPLARQQARRGQATVTNLRHFNVTVDAFAREVLMRLDGQRDKAQLFQELLDLVKQGRIRVAVKDGARPEPEKVRQIVSDTLDRVLTGVRRNHLVIS